MFWIPIYCSLRFNAARVAYVFVTVSFPSPVNLHQDRQGRRSVPRAEPDCGPPISCCVCRSRGLCGSSVEQARATRAVFPFGVLRWASLPRDQPAASRTRRWARARTPRARSSGCCSHCCFIDIWRNHKTTVRECVEGHVRPERACCTPALSSSTQITVSGSSYTDHLAPTPKHRPQPSDPSAWISTAACATGTLFTATQRTPQNTHHAAYHTPHTAQHPVR